MEVLHVEDELKHLVTIIEPLARIRSVDIQLNTTRQKIIGDRSLFRQALLNLMKNGLEAMPDGGQLSITVSDKENEMILEVSDTGIGMNNEQISRLGEPYYTTKGAQGTGLGMMVVFQVLEGMKSTITVQSTVGEGSRFIVTIPKAKVEF